MFQQQTFKISQPIIHFNTFTKVESRANSSIKIKLKSKISKTTNQLKYSGWNKPSELPPNEFGTKKTQIVPKQEKVTVELTILRLLMMHKCSYGPKLNQIKIS